MLTKALLILATMAVVLSGADATVETICKEASDKDTHVNYGFCVSELANTRASSNVDAWGLAKAAADLGINNAYLAIEDIKGLLAKSQTDAMTKVVLGQCNGFYDSIKFAFAGANERINERKYAAGKEEVAKAISLAHECDDVFVKAAIPSPLTQRSLYSV